MPSPMQKTYTCRCGKKATVPQNGVTRKCGCGRTATVADGRVTIQDKSRK